MNGEVIGLDWGVHKLVVVVDKVRYKGVWEGCLASLVASYCRRTFYDLLEWRRL